MERIRMLGGMGLVGLVLAGLGFAKSGAVEITAANCDATTGASVVVTGVLTTTNSASVYYTEKRHNGERDFCYGETSPSNCGKAATRNSGVNTQTVTGLKANTKYFYKIIGIYEGRVHTTVNGTFVTDGSGCGSTIVTTVQVAGTLLSASGDSLEKAVVKFTNATTNAVVAQDTSDLSGGFSVSLPAGNYKVDVSLPPFTAPPTVNITVIYGKPLIMKDITLSGAYQIGATITGAPKKDTLSGAIVTLTPKAGGTTLTRTTLADGHFTFPVLAGDYLLNITYGGKSLPAPMPITVAKSVELADIIFSSSMALNRPRALRIAPRAGAVPAVNAKGARVPIRGRRSISIFPSER